MVVGVPSDFGPRAPELFVLSLAGTDRWSWRLRAEPCADTDEIDHFKHGDIIHAERDAGHPGWLKLVDKTGWVKEDHEDLPVWTSVQSQSSAEVVGLEPISFADPESDSVNMGFADRSSASEGSKDFDGEFSVSDGSQSSLPVQAHVLASALPIPFTGTSYSICDKDVSRMLITSSVTTNMQWFTGQSCRIAPTPSETSTKETIVPTVVAHSAAVEAKQRWADMEDSDEETSSTEETAVVAHNAAFEAKQRWADMEDSDEEPSSTKEATVVAHSAAFAARRRWADMEDSDEETTVEDSDEVTASTNQTTVVAHSAAEESTDAVHSATCAAKSHWADMKDSDEDHMGNIPRPHKADMEDASDQQVSNPRRQKRNRDLLQRKNKTQLCRYVAETGMCPFGDKCWFAHNESEVKPDGNVEKDTMHGQSPQ